MPNDLISLGADVGGKDAHLATHSHIMQLRKLLSEACRGCYGSAVHEIALVLRIDGSVQSWCKSGVENLKFLKKNSFISADIYVPSISWSPGASENFIGFVAKEIILSLNMIKNHKNIKKTNLEIETLIADVERVFSKYGLQ